MSENYGYGKDIKMTVNNDGEVDLVVGADGDLSLIGGDGSDEYIVRVENAVQQMKMRLITPLNSLRDENNNPIPLGSALLASIGNKMTANTILFLKSSILGALQDLPFLASIYNIDFVTDRVVNPSMFKLFIKFSLKDDTEIYYTEFNLSEVT